MLCTEGLAFHPDKDVVEAALRIDRATRNVISLLKAHVAERQKTTDLRDARRLEPLIAAAAWAATDAHQTAEQVRSASSCPSRRQASPLP